jgi:ankyrin repeat protein
MAAQTEEGGRVIRLLLQAGGCDIATADKEGKTPLMHAAMSGMVETVFALTSAGCDVHAKDGKGRTALMYASMAEEDRPGTIITLLKVGCDIDAKDRSLTTALMYACREGNEKAVRLFLLSGYKCNFNDTDGSGRTALMYAAIHGNKEAVGMLLEMEGLDPHAMDTNAKTALSYAHNSRGDRYEKFEDYVEIQKMLKAAVEATPVEEEI